MTVARVDNGRGAVGCLRRGGSRGVGADGKRPTVETRRLRTATSFGIMKRVMLKQTQAYKLGVNIMFGAGNQYYNRHYEQ